VAQALSSYAVVTDATLNLLKHALGDHPNKDVSTWLGGLQHTVVLMQHTIGRLVNRTGPGEFPLKLEHIDVVVLMTRACDYYRRAATTRPIEIVFKSSGDVPMAWADRVAVAAVADRLLSHACEASTAGGTIVVQVLPGPGGVVCSVLDAGPTLTHLEQMRLFDPEAVAHVDSETARATRYGLIVAKELVGRLRGRLWSDCEPGKGTRISFRLPYQSDDSQPG
jgi:signal transduction histidine kinase